MSRWNERQELVKFASQGIRIPSLAFPYDEDFPAEASEFSLCLLVSRAVPFEFFRPVPDAALRDHALRASFMMVPKTSMHEYDLAMAGESKVRSSR